ncbi:uncharacterized protein LOC135485950 isoform X2 [Lineus longissimus]|uniref:uncharacterized protein LOC135485950 isoform X2 n=1 Tax=Lineus longissimus TaxID=88925 RepID=UPI002B4F5046
MRWASTPPKLPDTQVTKQSYRGMWKARSTGQIGRTLSTTVLTEDNQMMDDYLANECREFYLTRRRRAEEVKERLREDQQDRNSVRHSNLDDMMADLRKDMASLMERDLALMEQLLKMNDTIQDLKWQSSPISMSMSMSLCSRESLTDSNCTLASSTVSIPSEDSGLSGYESAPSVDNMKILFDNTCKTCPKQKGKDAKEKSKECNVVQMKMDKLVPLLTVSNVMVDQKGYHSTQNSLDSGCGDLNYQCQEVF